MIFWVLGFIGGGTRRDELALRDLNPGQIEEVMMVKCKKEKKESSTWK